MLECMRNVACEPQDGESKRIKVSYLEIIVTMIGKSHITKSSTRKSERIITM